MRTPVGSSKMVARSFAHSSPGWEPTGVIFTFCASAGAAARARTSVAPASVIRMPCSLVASALSHEARDGLGEGLRAERSAKVGGAGRGIRERRIARVRDAAGGARVRLVTAALGDPLEQHRRGEDERGRVRAVLARDVRRGAVLRLRGTERLAGIDGTGEPEAAGELGRQVRE